MTMTMTMALTMTRGGAHRDHGASWLGAHHHLGVVCHCHKLSSWCVI